MSEWIWEWYKKVTHPLSRVGMGDEVRSTKLGLIFKATDVTADPFESVNRMGHVQDTVSLMTVSFVTGDFGKQMGDRTDDAYGDSHDSYKSDVSKFHFQLLSRLFLSLIYAYFFIFQVIN